MCIRDRCGRYYGKDIVDMLEEIGFLTDKFLAVHCVNTVSYTHLDVYKRQVRSMYSSMMVRDHE